MRKPFQLAKGSGLMNNWRTYLVALGIGLATASVSDAACCYFSAKNADILQPSQKVFITWDPAAKKETFTVQPKFEGNAPDFGMVIPTPAEPKLHEMPRDFFSHLAIYSILKNREMPHSKLLPFPQERFGFFAGVGGGVLGAPAQNAALGAVPRKPAIKILDTGVGG